MAIEEVQFKICKDCGENKPIGEFYFQKACKKHYTKDRYSADCKLCTCKKRAKLKERIPNNIPINKTCSKCNQTKTIDSFAKNKYSPDKHKTECKECSNSYRRNEEYRKKQRERPETKLCRNAWQNESRKNPINKLRGVVNTLINSQITKFKINDPFLDLSFRIKYLPYTLEQLKLHLEELFEPWMTWDNHGPASLTKRTWQIDHIIPQSLLPFDSFTHPNFLKCWSLENLRPLEARENLRKGNKLIDFPSA